jgi:anti-sigma-K factor RskA
MTNNENIPGGVNDRTHTNGTNGAAPTGSDVGLNSGAYVLNALSAAENQEFETHLAGSETTRNEVTELSDTAVLLGLAVTPVQPSSALKANLMSKIASMPQLPREVAPVRTLPQPRSTESVVDDTGDAPASPRDSPLPSGSPNAPLPSDAPGSPVAPTAPEALSATATKTQMRWFNRPIVALTSVAAAIALIIGAGAISSQWGNSSSFEQQQADALAAITAADDMQRAAAEVSTGGTATLVWSEELASSALIVDGVAELPEGKTYELWYIDAAGTATPAGLFDVDDSDRTLRVLEGEMSAGDTVGVTVEPKGGSSTPTTDPIVAIASA